MSARLALLPHPLVASAGALRQHLRFTRLFVNMLCLPQSDDSCPYHTCSTSPSPHSQTAPPLCGVVLCLYLACPLGNTPSPAVRPMQEARVKVPEEDHRVISDARDGLLVLGSILLPCNHLSMQRGACNGGEYNLQSRIAVLAALQRLLCRRVLYPCRSAAPGTSWCGSSYR